MTLSFPNPSRSFDTSRNAVRFSGHDGMFEVRFLVEAAALSKLHSTAHMATSDGGWLEAFDAQRGSIQDVAREAYSHGKRTSYLLTKADFR